MAENPYGEEVSTVSFGGGLFTADLPSAIPDNYCAQCDNAVSTGTSVENRFGFKKSSLAFNEIMYPYEVAVPLSYLGHTGGTNNPTLVWGQIHPATTLTTPVPTTYKTHFLREGEKFDASAPGATGYFTINSTSYFIGAINYNGFIYVFYSNYILKITSINWAVPSIVSATVLNTPPLMSAHPIHFFDRLWTAHNSRLYFTNAVTTPGGLPETWNISSNFIDIVGRNGPGIIYKLIPLGSRIYIFTSAGLFSLTIAGSPSDWYLRPLDEKAIVNTYDCAFENGGLIYYITIYGVFVTNGSDSVKLSGSIENFFLIGNFQGTSAPGAKQSNLYRIHYLDGGMIISITSLASSNEVTPQMVFDAPHSYTFYTRMGSVAWSEWDFNTPEGETKLLAILGVADSVLSHINSTPVSYIMTQQGWSTPNLKGIGQRELMIYDGLKDEWTNPGYVFPGFPAPVGLLTEADIIVKIATRFFEGSNLIHYKQLKYGYLEIYCSDPTKLSSDGPQWHYEWRTESGIQGFEADSLSEDNLDQIQSLGEFIIVKLRSGFTYRIAQLYFEFDTNNSETFKVKNIHLKQDTLRDGPYFIG